MWSNSFVLSGFVSSSRAAPLPRASEMFAFSAARVRDVRFFTDSERPQLFSEQRAV
jgi:hypothetical protein